MGLFGSKSGPCFFCDGKVTKENGAWCNECGTYFHGDCMRKNGLVEHESHLLRADKDNVKCPGCGYVGSFKS